MKRKRNLILIVSQLVVIISLIMFLFIEGMEWFEDKSLAKIKLNAAYTKGEVTNVFFSKVQCISVKYRVDYRYFEVTSALGFGDELYIKYYKIIYDNNDPQNARILIQEPLFNKTDNIDSTLAKIIQIDGNFIRYEYQLNNNKYKKFQEYFDISNFQIGQNIICYYVKDFPEEAIADYPNFKVNQNYLK